MNTRKIKDASPIMVVRYVGDGSPTRWPEWHSKDLLYLAKRLRNRYARYLYWRSAPKLTINNDGELTFTPQ